MLGLPPSPSVLPASGATLRLRQLLKIFLLALIINATSLLTTSSIFRQLYTGVMNSVASETTWKPVELEHRLSYRTLLEKQYAGHNYTLGSSATFTFDNIYVLSLAGQIARQETMGKVADALGMEFEIFNASSRDEPVVGWIAERVKEIRDMKRPLIAAAAQTPEASVGGMGIDSPWFRESDPTSGLVLPDLSATDRRWQVDGEAVNWTDYAAVASRSNLPQVEDEDVVRQLWDPVEREKFRQLNKAIISTWHSHLQMWRHMLERGDRTALFLEDDVDIEWDFERLWVNVERSLPIDWHIVHLGHCWGKTRSKPMYVNPILRQGSEPRCSHAYALSAAGATRLLDLMNSPWSAYQSAIDLMLARLVREKKVSAFVVEPPLVVQSKKFGGSIQPGKGNAWKGLLMDSTLDRIARSEGSVLTPLTWAETRNDPCIWNS